VNEPPKLPQARMYLQSAQWGFDELLTKQLNGYAYRFYLIGILASLRAVQHALKNHDSKLSEEHRRVIEIGGKPRRSRHPNCISSKRRAI
jgi:hypothetical protein